MDVELKPCPFCGGEPEKDYRQGYSKYPSGGLDHAAAIYCTNCDASMSMCRADTPELSDEERMSVLDENWNRRAHAARSSFLPTEDGEFNGNVADTDALISRVEKMEKDNERLAEFARSILRIVFEGGDIDGGTAQDMGVEYGLLERQDFDPKRHTDSTGYAEPGDDWYVFSGPAALQTRETE